MNAVPVPPLLVDDNLVCIARILLDSMLLFDLDATEIDKHLLDCYFVFQGVAKSFTALLERNIPVSKAIRWRSLRWYYTYHIAAAFHRIHIRKTEPNLIIGGWQSQVAELFENGHLALGSVLRLAMYRRSGFSTLMMRLVVEVYRATPRIPIYHISLGGRFAILATTYFSENLGRKRPKTLAVGIASTFYNDTPSRGIIIHDVLPDWRNRPWVINSATSTTILHIGPVGFPDMDQIIMPPLNAPQIVNVLQ